MKRYAFYAISILALAVLLTGCGTKKPTVQRPEGTIAVATFTNPVYSWQLLAGYLDKEGVRVDPTILSNLDGILANDLTAHGVKGFIPAASTVKCQELVKFDDEGRPRMSAFQYWLGVAKCQAVDYLLVPQVLRWQERQGSAAGVTEPASVIIDLYLIDVKNKSIRRAHYDETQESLTSNLLTAPKFFKRGGKWVPAMELAKEGIDAKLKELGL